jgi:hypothetical protein
VDELHLPGRDAGGVGRRGEAPVYVIVVNVGVRAGHAKGEEQRHERGGGQPHLVLLAGAVAGWLLAAVSIIAGVGLLYLLRQGGLLHAGPPVSDALPLERLARADAQPLLRVLAAWLPAGAAATACLIALARLRPATSVVATGLLGLLLLTVAGASSEAVENSERVAPHLLLQLGRPGLIVAVAALVAGGALASALLSGRRPSP